MAPLPVPPRHPPIPVIVPDKVAHTRAMALTLLQIPVAAAWGFATVGTTLAAVALLDQAQGTALLPLGLPLAFSPLLVSGAMAVAATGVSVGAPLAVDAIMGQPSPGDEALGQLALESGLFMLAIAVVTGGPMSLAPLLLAAGLRADELTGQLLAYSLLAGFIPLIAAPTAAMEAANDSGYRAELPLWCLTLLRICSFGAAICL